jgi:hypothetical protein
LGKLDSTFLHKLFYILFSWVVGDFFRRIQKIGNSRSLSVKKLE